jgi:hypothetical protein
MLFIGVDGCCGDGNSNTTRPVPTKKASLRTNDHGRPWRSWCHV